MAVDGDSNTGTSEDQLVSAVASFAKGKIVDKSSSTEEKNDGGTGGAEENSGGAESGAEGGNENNNSNSEKNGEAQNEHHEQNQGEVKNDEKNGEQQDGDNAQEPEKLIQKEILELKELPEHKGVSDEDLRKIVIKKVVERSLNPDNKNENGDAPKVIDLNAEVKKSTDGKFDSIEQIFEATKRPELTFANDQIKHLNELALKGVKIDQVLAFANLKIDDLDPSNIEDAKKLIRIEMRQNEAGITDEEIDYDLRQLYDLTEQKNEDEEVTNKEAIRNAELKLLRNARNAKDKLITKQKELEIPPSNANTAPQGPTDEQKRDWSEKVDNSLANYEALEIPIGNDQNFKFQIAPESKKTLQTTMLQPEAFLSRYVKNGEANMEKFRRDMTIIENFETITKAIHAQGDASGAKRVMDSIQNPSTEKSGNQGGSGAPVKTGLSAVAEAYSSTTV